jgi:SAM-dependent methyltransferase
MAGVTADFWDEQAATFDDQPDHGLRDADVRAAWQTLLLGVLPAAPASVTDLGCGTGSLAVLLAQHGFLVRGLDRSARMVAAACDKAAQAGMGIEFREGDAAVPPYPKASSDVVLARHVLWAMPDPAAALAKWVDLLRPGGRLVLVEGRWHTGAGLAATECEQLVRRHHGDASVRPLPDPALWGGPVTDERYLIVSAR